MTLMMTGAVLRSVQTEHQHSSKVLFCGAMAPLLSLPHALLLITILFFLHSCHSDIIKTHDQVKTVENESESKTPMTCASGDGQCAVAYTTPTCGIWLAKSTIPNAGLGMFAGKPFQNGQDLLESGDIVIPIVDFSLHQWKYHYRLLWDDYTWDSDSTLSSDEGLVEVNAASPGFGACANSYLDLQNVDECRPSVDNAGLDRTKDPGAGASSAYYNRRSIAKGNIEPGQELFVSYGSSWFESRRRLGAIPLKGDHRRGQVLLESSHRMQQRLNISTQVYKDIWQRFIWDSPYYNNSRLLNALPDSWDDLEFAKARSLLELRKSKHRVTSEWLREHGSCMDNMKVAPSTLPQAGRGAFATRFLQKGTVVAPIPLIHLPHKDRLQMYNVKTDGNGKSTVHDRQNVTRHQLMENYCYGHTNSSLLLCPYGVMTAAVNHNQTLANVKLTWSDPVKTEYHSEWLDRSIESLVAEKSTGLIMDLVATRDIQPGEELFLDYGNEWEEAWNRHLQAWKPANGIAVDTLNNNFKTPLKTVSEQMENPYPEGIKMKCETAFKFKSKWKRYADSHESLMDYISHEDEYQQDCDLLQREQDEHGNIVYTAVLIDEEKGEKVAGSKLEKVPREAFVFVHTPYASDMHLPNAFRHSIMVPDEIFPDTWKNTIVADVDHGKIG
jgi:hypothetical protein